MQENITLLYTGNKFQIIIEKENKSGKENGTKKRRKNGKPKTNIIEPYRVKFDACLPVGYIIIVGLLFCP